MSRLWFMSDDNSSLVQVQPDRLIVNWRSLNPSMVYPRFPWIRERFLRYWADLDQFVRDKNIGELEVTQVELNYINAIDTDASELGRVGRILATWVEGKHHLGEPEQAHIGLSYRVDGVGTGPVRLYVNLDPAQRPDGTPSVFLTMTVRGAPAGAGIKEAIAFVDAAHDHVVRSFAELTTEAIQETWERKP